MLLFILLYKLIKEINLFTNNTMYLSYLILVILIIFLFFYVIKNDLIYDTEQMHIDDIYDLCETSDIIYFRWNEVDFHHEIISPFTHIGMVVVKPDNQKYIIETHLSGDTSDIGTYRGGINVYPLKLRLNNYKGHTFLSKIKLEYKPNQNQIQDFILKINDYKSNIPFHDDYKGYFINNCLKNRLFNTPIEKKKGMFCSEFMGFCLKELNIVDDDFIFNCLVPGDFRYIKNKESKLIYQNLIKINT